MHNAQCTMQTYTLKISKVGLPEFDTIESRATVYATGNNIQPTGDVIRRVITSSLDPNLERPELRAFGRWPAGRVMVAIPFRERTHTFLFWRKL